MRNAGCFFLIAVAALGQRAPVQNAPQQGAPAEKCAVAGQIVDALTGAPLKKAQVTLRRVEGRNTVGSGTTTDASGQFSMQEIDAGRYRLTADRNGFVRQEYGARGAGRQGTVLTLEPGQRLTDVMLKLTPHSILSGVVADEDAEPISGVNVQLLKYSYRNGRKTLTPAGYAQTNDLGEYRVFGVAPGRYYISAIYRQSFGIVDRTARAGAQAPEQVYAPTYYPGTTDAASAAPLELAAGHQISGINFTLRKRSAVRLRGTIGRPGSVFLTPRNSVVGTFNRNMTRVRDRSGNFELRGVLPGSYLLGTDIDDGEKHSSARLPIEIGASDIDNIRLTPTPHANIAGVVRTEGDAAATLTTVRVYLRPLDAGPNQDTIGAAVKDNGAFLLEDAGPNAYAITLAGIPDAYYLKSIRFGDREVLDAPLDLSNGGGGALEVLLGAGGGSIAGVVNGAKLGPAQGATVVLVPELSRREQLYRYKTATTDQYGKFQLTSIPPGEYKVFAWEDVELGAYLDPDFLRPVEERGLAFSIKESSRESAQLKLIAAEDNGPASQ